MGEMPVTVAVVVPFTEKSVVSTPLKLSLKVARKMRVSALVGLVAGLKRVKEVVVGALVSMTMALLLPNEPAVLGEARVRLALFVDAS